LPIAAHEGGPALRDWLITMSALAKLKPEDRPAGLYPMAAIHGRLPLSDADQKTGWKWRHAMLVLNESGKPFSLDIEGLGKSRFELRVHAPDGAIVSKQNYDDSKATTKFSVIHVDVPADGKKGVYTFELLSNSRFPDVLAAQSSTGKLLHVVSLKEIALVSGQFAGTLWFQPTGDQDVDIGWIQRTYPWGRTVIFNSKDELVASSKLRGTVDKGKVVLPQTAGRWAPEGTTCKLPASEAKKDELYSCVIPVSVASHLWWEIKGTKPYVATKKEEWFDPTKFPCPALDEIISGKLN
jgi:hypothetical protein